MLVNGVMQMVFTSVPRLLLDAASVCVAAKTVHIHDLDSDCTHLRGSGVHRLWHAVVVTNGITTEGWFGGREPGFLACGSMPLVMQQGSVGG